MKPPVTAESAAAGLQGSVQLCWLLRAFMMQVTQKQQHEEDLAAAAGAARLPHNTYVGCMSAEFAGSSVLRQRVLLMVAVAQAAH
jgi:hypothetical protein